MNEFKTKKIHFWVNNKETFDDFDGLLLRGDKNPNTKGLLKVLEKHGINATWGDLEKGLKDGSIKTLGFMPLLGYYENSEAHWAPSTGAAWLKDDGTSAVGSSAGWAEFLTWQKGLIDKLGGYDKLAAFQAALGQEFSEQNDFQTGRVAMNVDGLV